MRQSQYIDHKWIVKVKSVIFEPGKTHLFLNISSCPIALLVHRNPQHRSFFTVVLATSAPSFQPLCHQRSVCHQGGFITDQTDGSHKGPSPGCKVDVQEVPTVVLEFSPGLIGLYVVWHCHYEAVPILPVGLTFCANCNPKFQQNFTVQCRIHIFTMLLKMG
jgi:hypothetical protein